MQYFVSIPLHCRGEQPHHSIFNGVNTISYFSDYFSITLTNRLGLIPFEKYQICTCLCKSLHTACFWDIVSYKTQSVIGKKKKIRNKGKRGKGKMRKNKKGRNKNTSLTLQVRIMAYLRLGRCGTNQIILPHLVWWECLPEQHKPDGTIDHPGISGSKDKESFHLYFIHLISMSH